MNVRIDIKTSAGQSLEGFPVEIKIEELYHADTITTMAADTIEAKGLIKLHSGDTITIKIL